MTYNENRLTDDPQPKSYIPNPSPLDATYATWFTPANPEILLTARQSLELYRQRYQERAQTFPPYPYRIIIARPTGLPVFLRGFLDAPVHFTSANNRTVIDVADQWLFTDLRVGALFGLRADEVRQRLKLALESFRVRFGEKFGEIQPIDEAGARVQRQIERDLAEQAVPLAPQAHVHFQQWHGNWPLFGARAVVHLTSDDERVSVTSSYCPIAADKAFEPVINAPEAAFDLALLALRDYVHSAEYAERIGLPIPDLSKWLPHSTPYIGQAQFILPFAGDYHLVYQVEMTSPDYEQNWRAFVDCERQIVLGRPELLKLPAKYHSVTSDALVHPLILAEINLGGNPCANFLDIGIYQGGAPVLDGPVDWGTSEEAGANFEAVNVAIHAQRMFTYFVDLDVAQADLEEKFVDANNVARPWLRARIAKPGLPQLDMGFYFGETIPPQQHWISFQRDDSPGGSGLPALTGKRVLHPTYDPEVIYHELTHALMWLMNRPAFDGCNGNVPFGRALLEGYANYFGRSLAARYEADVQNQTVPPDQPWARAAYRTDTTAVAWSDQWAMARTKRLEGQDWLPIPNLYPNLNTTGLPVYDVGMVWARGMWDLRAQVLPLDIDRFALGAFDYLHGWIATFELVVEGMIDVAKSVPGFDTRAETVFGARGIVANQSIQAITSLGPVVLVGADAGLMRLPGAGQNWQNWDQAQDQAGNALDPLRNIVALTVDGATFYAATEAGVWQRADTGAAWQPVGNWPLAQTPYVLGVFQGTLYVGTGNGVWWYDAAANVWQPLFRAGSSTDFVGASLDLAFIALTRDNGTEEKWIIAATFGEARMCNVTTPPALSWRSIANDSESPICSVAVRNGDLYLGTVNEGLQRLSLLAFLEQSDPPVPEAAPTAVSGAVLTLINRPTEVVAASTTGLFHRDDFTASGVWKPVVMTPCPTLPLVTWPVDAKIVFAHQTDTDTWISTAAHGLWRLNGNGICRVDEVAPLIQ